MEDNWDLFAVVKSCSSAAASASMAANAPPCQQDLSNFTVPCLDELFHPTRLNFFQDLNDLYKPFFPKFQNPPQTVPSPQSLPISPLSVLGGLPDLPSEPQLMKPQLYLPIQTEPMHKPQPFSVVNASNSNSNSKPTTTPRSKRRKNHLKKVCHVAAANLSSDQWSWRKYGQKPIKGSPYPRGYYKCSTSKCCLARKQVERNRSDPGMFILTYTGEHNHPVPTHRNSLAGSTRHKGTSDEPSKPSPSPEPEKMESSREDLPEVEELDEDCFSEANMALDDDFFDGLEDFAGGECGPSQFPVLFDWSASSAAATTTAG